LGTQPIEADSFVGGVLIQDHQAIVGFADEVRPGDLTDDP
jgi:hypothetical protein